MAHQKEMDSLSVASRIYDSVFMILDLGIYLNIEKIPQLIQID
jgi:hypothetical protein